MHAHSWRLQLPHGFRYTGSQPVHTFSYFGPHAVGLLHFGQGLPLVGIAGAFGCVLRDPRHTLHCMCMPLHKSHSL